MMKNIPASLLLAAILLFAGILRFTGQNWDDFSHTHPDERFLTLNLLPQVGDYNEFTPDETNFPSQKIITLADAALHNQFDIQYSPTVRIAAAEDTFSYRAANWLVDSSQVFAYENDLMAMEALQAAEVDAVIVSGGAYLPDANIISDPLTSQAIQALRCQYLHPEGKGIGAFFDTRCSPLNPHQAGQGFYTYGTFPLFLTYFTSKTLLAAETIAAPLFNWQGGHLVWRGLSMIFDLLTVLLVFALGTRMHSKWAGLIAAVLYAAAPLAIQKAHFGTVNAITSFLVTGALYCAVAVQQRGKLWAYLGFGIACGAAVASRINAAPLAGMIVLAALAQAMPVFDSRLSQKERSQLFVNHFFGLILAGFGAFLAFRIFNPYAFEGPGFFGMGLNNRWLDNISSGSHGVSGHQDWPPNWQWLARPPYFYPLKDMLLWSMGLGFGILAWFGWGWSVYRLVRNHKGAAANLVLLAWIGLYFAWMGGIWVMTPRYYLPMYGALAVLAGWGLCQLHQYARRTGRDSPMTRLLLGLYGILLGAVGGYQWLNGIVDATSVTTLGISGILLAIAVFPILRSRRAWALGAFCILFSMIWGVMFSNVYRHQTTLVQSSRFLFERIPGDFAMRIEGSDDSVPLINLAISNNGYQSSTLTGRLFERATYYTEAVPVSVEFTAPADGTVTNVFAPHLGDPLDDMQPERIEMRVYAKETGAAIAEAALETNLLRDNHPLGGAYTIPFDTPLQVEAGKTYRFEVVTAAGSGDVIGSGSVVVTEGDWDNRVTAIHTCQLPDGLALADKPPSGLAAVADCHGTQAWFSLINAYDQAMSFPIDNQIKYDDILRSLDLGDYLTIASNRFYDTETRNPLRWPLTTRYYDKLFAGELGYELLAVFDEGFEWGPWRVADQHLPIYDSPAWLNELEADEAFHVYDHPAAFIFRKTEHYSPARVKAILSKASLLQIHEIAYIEDDAQLLGVINWPSIEADAAPTALTLPPDSYETQTNGGTWSERFFSDSLMNTHQAFGVAVWYLTLLIFGILAFPLMFSLFPNMADGGYGFSKLVGLLLVAWFAWALSSLKIPLWSQSGVMVSLGAVTLLSLTLGYRNRVRLGAFLRNHWKRLAWMEVLAVIAFGMMIAVRLTNPDLWHYAKGGEKPMDFAYLNGVLRSTTFPPIDPWFAGGYINYYYFGYVLLGSPVLLLGAVPAFAYNLMIPSVFMMTGMGAFSSAFNLLARWRAEPSSASPASRRGNPWLAGIMALLLCVALGNLDTVRVLGSGIARLGGYESPLGLESFLVEEYTAANGSAPTAEARAELAAQANQANLFDNLRYEVSHSLSLAGGMVRGAVDAIGGKALPIGHDRWYWGPTRVLAETHGVGGNAINEMPYFTFLYGDLHAHMINMPLILLTILFVFSELVQVGRDHRRRIERFLALALGAMSVGLMQATNTWDWPSMTLFAIVGLAYVWWRRWRHTFRPISDIRFYGAALAMLVVSTVAVTRLPFTDALGIIRSLLLAGMGLVVLWIAVRHFLVRASTIDLLANLAGFMALSLAFALPYTSWHATTYNSIHLWTGGKTPLWAYFDIHGLFLFLVVSILLWESGRWLRNVPVKILRGHRSAFKRTGIVLILAGLLTAALGMADYQAALIVLPLVIWIAILFFRPGQSLAMRFMLALIGLALSMTLGVEIIVIGGDIGRQNTVFKFYIQAWLLLSVAGGAAFSCLFQASNQWGKSLRILWYVPCILLFFIAGLYPVMATPARALDRMAPDLPLTLNGLDYMQQSTYYETAPSESRGEDIDLGVDYELMRWMQENIVGSPVIMEGRRYPSEYQWNGRFAITTGLPSVLGWNYHQRQQRTLDPLPRWVDQRDLNIRAFYNTADVDAAIDLLYHYDVKYIVHSGLERVQSSPAGQQKFDIMVNQGLLSVAYAIDGGAIYQVNEAALLQYLMERNR